MKKFLALIGVAAVALSLCACNPDRCEGCGREADTEKYTYEGESAYLCEDCGAIIDLANEWGN